MIEIRITVHGFTPENVGRPADEMNSLAAAIRLVFASIGSVEFEAAGERLEMTWNSDEYSAATADYDDDYDYRYSHRDLHGMLWSLVDKKATYRSVLKELAERAGMLPTEPLKDEW